MIKSFSILRVVNQSLGIMTQNIGHIFAVTIGVFVAAVAILFTTSFILGFLSSIGGGIISLLGVSVLFVFMLIVFGSIFNYWVRLGVYGREGAWPGAFSNFIKPGLSNGLKFILIGILMMLALIVIVSVMTMLGVDIPQQAMPDMTGREGSDFLALYMEMMREAIAQPMTTDVMAYTMTTTLTICFIYAFFSANLTKTALGDKASSYETPHVADFAVALILIYLIIIIPVIILSALELYMTSFVYQLVVSIPIGAAIGIAHGVRHRMCLGTDRPDVFEIKDDDHTHVD